MTPITQMGLFLVHRQLQSVHHLSHGIHGVVRPMLAANDKIVCAVDDVGRPLPPLPPVGLAASVGGRLVDDNYIGPDHLVVQQLEPVPGFCLRFCK